jgi:Putative polyhydroxyalkanoic acid system protein (PHA_gran_rgn)
MRRSALVFVMVVGVSASADSRRRAPVRGQVNSSSAAKLIAPPIASPPLASVVAEIPPPPVVLDEHDAISVRVPHAFDRQGAHERISQLLAYWSDRFGVKNEWRGDRVFITGTVYGLEIKAIFEVNEGDVACRSNDPGSFWRAKAMRYVENKLRKYLSPTYAEP